LDLQDAIQAKYTGGTVFHTFAGERIDDPQSVKRLVKKYVQLSFALSDFYPTFSVCPSHGYIKGEQEKCPTCAEECEVYSRVVGYLRPSNNE